MNLGPPDFQVARECPGADLAEAVGFGEVFDADYRHGDLWDTDLRDEHRFFLWIYTGSFLVFNLCDLCLSVSLFFLGFMGHRFTG